MIASNSAGIVRAMTELRSAARRLGLMPYLSRVRSLVRQATGTAAYEAHFDRALTRCVRKGDVVWDVGANVGLYTTRLSEAVGEHGRVIAFEPVPSCFAELLRRTEGRANVLARKVALGAERGAAPMKLDGNPLSTTNSLVAAGEEGTVSVPVEVACELVESGQVPAPNVAKIDVEGFEEEVLQGFGPLLRAPGCRALLIEIHFGLLDQRGRRQAPARISAMLRSAGFDVRWVDASHLEAIRP